MANEIQISPELLGCAIEWYAKSTYVNHDTRPTEIILKSKFGSAFKNKVQEIFYKRYDDKFAVSIASTLSEIFLEDISNPENRNTNLIEILKALKSGLKENQCNSILGLMVLIFGKFRTTKTLIVSDPIIDEIFSIMLELLKQNDIHYNFSICWSVAWAGERNVFPDILRNEYTTCIMKLWIKTSEYNMNRLVSWALSKILMPSIPPKYILVNNKVKNIIQERYQNPRNEFDKLVSIYLGVILGDKYDIKEIEGVFKSENVKYNRSSSLTIFSNSLGINLNKENNQKD